MQVLSNTQRDYLRKLAHRLKPVVQVGKNGVSDSVMESIKGALDSHELIKVKFLDAQEERRAVAEDLASETGSTVVAAIGNVVVLYREQPDPEERMILLPALRDERGGRRG